MSVDNSELMAFQNQIQALKDDIPEIMDSLGSVYEDLRRESAEKLKAIRCVAYTIGGLAVGEGRYARDQARKICKEENIVNTGDYRRNFKSGTKAIRAGNSYKIDVFNNLDYAKPLEYGFRSHFVPGHWEGNSFKYQRNDPDGGYVRGHFTLRRAIRRTKTTQAARLNRKMDRIIRQRMNGGGTE